MNPLLLVPTEPAIATDPDDLCGSVLAGRYRLLRILGRGGMGYVYLAEHTTIGRRLAVKVLGTQLAREQEFRERFLREARAVSALAHENVVQVTDYGETPNDSVFLAMELLEGEELSETIARDGPLPWLRAKRIILQVCRALHAAHQAGIVHRDVKPENCFRVKRGANRDFVKVLDFGLAKAIGDEHKPEESLTRRGTVFGTPEYMSPEQARGRPVDARSDVYSTGILLYELVTGTLPFMGEHFMDVLTKHCTEEPTPPRVANPGADASDELEAVILRCLRKEADARFASIQALGEALAAIPVTPRHDVANARSAPATERDAARAYKLVILVLLGVVTLLSGALFTALIAGG